MSDMTASLNDLSYIPPSNEQNEPTQGDIGETSNEPTQAICNEFEELYVCAIEELYPGYDFVTRLDFMAQFTDFKVKCKLTDSIFNEMLEFFQMFRQRYIDKDPGVRASGELFALACGPTSSPISVNSCVVNGVRFIVHSRDERHTTQNRGICSPGDKDEETYYGQLKEILEFSYMSFNVVLFRVKWFDTGNERRKIKCFVIRNNITQILAHGESFKDDQYILSTQVKQVFYLEDMARQPQLEDIIDVDEDDDLIDDEDVLPHDLADFDDEDLANDIYYVAVVYSNVARGHDGDGGGNDRSPPLTLDFHRLPRQGNPKTQQGRQKSRQTEYPRGTRNLGLRKITDQCGP
nr:hypothetical protein [Tanacetum cinerariifolium]